jgi:hypothetical protein
MRNPYADLEVGGEGVMNDTSESYSTGGDHVPEENGDRKIFFESGCS